MSRFLIGGAKTVSRKRAMPSILLVVMLVMVSAASVIVASESLSSGPSTARLEIVDVTSDPSEAHVDQAVIWTVTVEILYEDQRGKGLLFTWDWDDGSCTVYRLKSVQNTVIATDVQTHAWSEPGLYKVTVSVWDGYDPEQNKHHNVSATVPIVVSDEPTGRSVDYRLYDMFNHPLGSWYEARAQTTGEVALTDEYPYLYTKELSPPGNLKIYTFMRMDMDAVDLTEVNMNENPEFLPLFSETSRGGTAEIDWYLNYITEEEAERLGPAATSWYDGWYVALNGTVALDRDASKAVLDIDDSQFDSFGAWWFANEGAVEMEWANWMQYEAGPERLAIWNMYEYDLQFILFDLEAEKVGDAIVITMDTVSWGAEALLTRWLREAFMPTEWYFEDMSLHATVTPDKAEIDFDAAIGYSLHAYESLDGTPCWVWEAMLQDYVAAPDGYPPSDFEPYVDLDYYCATPGNAWHDYMVPYEYTPGAWNLAQGETLTIEWPADAQAFFVHDPGYTGETLVEDTRQVYSEMTVRYAEPMPSDADCVTIDEDARQISFIGPFDMWTWSNEQVAHESLADEWDRLGVLPHGAPYIEFGAAGPANMRPTAAFTVDPPSGTVDTVFVFDASSSSDPEDPAEVLETRWDWEGDGVWDTGWNTTDVTPARVFSVADVYDVTLQVMDSDGLTDVATKSVVVAGVPPSGTPTLLETDDTGNAWSPKIDVDHDGNAIAVWTQFDGSYDSIMANRFDVDTGWGGADVIEMNDMAASSPEIDVDSDGNAVVVWSQHDTTHTSVWAVQYDVDTGWGDPELLRSVVSTLECIPQCSVAVDGFGGAIAVWNQEDGLYSSIWACRLDGDTGWSDPELLESSDSGNAWDPKIATDQCNWTVVWQQFDGGLENIWAVRYEMNAYWTAPEAVDEDDAWSTFNPVVAADGYGRAICVWQQYENSWSSIFASRFVPGSGWGAPLLIEQDDTGDAVDPQISMEPRGTATVVWRQLEGHEIDGDPADILSNRFEVGSGWGSEEYVDSDPATDAWGPKVAMSFYAGPVAIWMRSDGAQRAIWSSWYDADDGWCEPMLVGGDDSSYVYPSDVAVDLGGNTIAVWHQLADGVWSVWANRYECSLTPEQPSEPSLTYRIYDMFEFTAGPWWDTRLDSYWDTERILTSGEDGFTYMYNAEGTRPNGLNDRGLIYAPYRWSVSGVNLPNLDIHSPVFMPAFGPVTTGGAVSLDVWCQYANQEFWDDWVIPTYETNPDWYDDFGESFLSTVGDDGYITVSLINVTMNREAAEEWLGMGELDAPSDWWDTNRDMYISDWRDWLDYQGNEVYDIYSGYEWPYVDMITLMDLEEDGDDVSLRIFHTSWGYEVLLTRWLLASELSVHQPWMEDIRMVVDYRDADCDFDLDGVAQWSMHCNLANESAPGQGAPCSWVWEPIGIDHIESSSMHPDSQYDPYTQLTYQSWNVGDPQFSEEIPYEITPWAFSLPEYGRLVVELPTGSDVVGYYGQSVPEDAMDMLWDGDSSAYDAIRYTGEMDLGYADLSGCEDWFYDAVNKMMVINGPWTFTNPRDGDLLYHGAPWIEFTVAPPSLGVTIMGSSSSEEPTTTSDAAPAVETVGGMSGLPASPLCVAVLTIVALVVCAGRRHGFE